LFICKGIVEQHGGQIVVSSHLGVGSTFQVSLPLAPVEVGAYAA
jgi:signal transduction histidine kinase